MVAEVRGDSEGMGVIVAGCDHLGKTATALVPFAAEAARLASRCAGARRVARPAGQLAPAQASHLRVLNAGAPLTCKN
jgi:hypothetical protein